MQPASQSARREGGPKSDYLLLAEQTRRLDLRTPKATHDPGSVVFATMGHPGNSMDDNRFVFCIVGGYGEKSKFLIALPFPQPHSTTHRKEDYSTRRPPARLTNYKGPMSA